MPVPPSTNLALWLNAGEGVFADAGSTPAANSDPVEQWNDQSGNARHASQGTSSLRPTLVTGALNGEPVIRFDGGDDYMTAAQPSGAAKTLFIIAKKGLAPDLNTRTLIALDDVARVVTDSDLVSATNWTYRTIDTNLGQSAQAWSIITLKYASTSSLTPYINGVAGTAFDPANQYSTSTSCSIGARLDGLHRSDVDVAEVLIYSTALSDADRGTVEQYLIEKYLAPVAPSSLVAAAVSDTEIDLDWTDNSAAGTNETEFEIQYDTANTFDVAPQTTTAAQDAISKSIAGLSASTTYYFRVRGVNAFNGEWSNTANATTDGGGGIPSAPGDCAATTESASTITVDWTDNSGDEDNFELEVSRQADFSVIDDTLAPAANATSALVSGLLEFTLYYFRVRAVNVSGDSAWSNTASATTEATIPDAPSLLSATTVSHSQIDLAWTDNADNETGFEIDYDTANTFDVDPQATTATANATSKSITGLGPSTQYFFRVRATNSAGDSANSNTANATTDEAPPVGTIAVDAFAGAARTLDGPYDDGFAINPSDSEELAFVTRGIYVSSSGSIAVTMRDGSSTTFTNVPVGFHPIRVRKVFASGTTATGLIGLI